LVRRIRLGIADRAPQRPIVGSVRGLKDEQHSDAGGCDAERWCRDRGSTCGTTIFSRVLYRLSYLAVVRFGSATGVFQSPRASGVPADRALVRSGAGTPLAR